MRYRFKTCRAAIAAVCVSLLAACGGEDSDARNQPPAPPPLSAMAQLGETIFFDGALSASGRQSCATCHAPSRAFSSGDGLSASMGGRQLELQGLRNAPTLAYAGFIPPFSFDGEGEPVGGLFHDGRANTLAEQAEGPFISPFEMANASAEEVLGRLLQRPYLGKFAALFGEAATQTPQAALRGLGQALAQYQKEDPSFQRFDSKFDAYMLGKAALTDSERNGLVLFNAPNKGNCAACHVSTPNGATPALFTDFTYDNIGVPRNWKLGANRGGELPFYAPANGTSLGAPGHDYYDLGLCGPLRADLSTRTDLCGRFRVPTLRNVALTAPYFHNGVFDSLQEAVAWYITRDVEPARWYRRMDGGVDKPYNDLPALYEGNVNKDEVPYSAAQAPTMTDSEMADLVHFLCTLTDGYDAADPTAYRVPAQCNATADSIAAIRRGSAVSP